MRIVFDFDHTLNNMLFVWVDALNKRHRLQVKYEDIKDWDMEKNFPTLTSDEIYEPLHDPKYWGKVECWENVGHAFNKLRSLGDEVFVASSTHPSYASIKYNNCMKSIIPVVTQNIIFTYRKDIIDCNVIVDDYPPNIANNKAMHSIFKEITEPIYLAPARILIT